MYAKRITLLFMLTIVTLFVSSPEKIYAQTKPLIPLGPHCKRGGPLPLNDPNFCGCTWGAVYYRGQPVVGANVTLQFGAQMTQTLTQKDEDETFPFYVTSGVNLGAQRADVMTATVTFASQTATQAFRALPDSTGEQQVTLVLPAQGVWTPWISGGYTRTLVMNGSTLWAGGSAGLLSIDTTSGVSTTQSIPWTDPSVVGVATAGNSHGWAIGPHSLAEFDGAQWQNRPVPFAGTLRALAVHPATGALWLGGGDNIGALAVYDGVWHSIPVVGERVTTLLVDSANNVWVGTWGGGLYRHAGDVANLNQGWTQITINEGLASNYLLSAATRDHLLWFGTRPYVTGQGYRGGISRYDLTDNTWRTYTVANGLPTDPNLHPAPASIFAMTVDAQGTPWAGTLDGVYVLATPDSWANHLATGGDAIRALASSDNQLIVARASGRLAHYDPNVIPGNPPTAQLATVSTPRIDQSGVLVLTASAVDHDDNSSATASQILAWDWRSDRDGPLCTTAETCRLSGAELSLGTHTISLRVQDDEGVWSQPVSTTITVTPGTESYLPLVMR